MQKVKHDFQVANQEILLGNVYMIQNCFTVFDCNSCLTFKLSTACSTLNPVVIIQSSNSVTIRQWNKYPHGTLRVVQKRNDCFNWKETIWSSNKEKRKQGDKKEKLTGRIITLDSENSQKVELYFWSHKTWQKQNHCGNHKAALK